jgi:hypothetical protein
VVVEEGGGPDIISLNIQILPLCCSSLALLNGVLAMLCRLSCVQSVKSCVNLWVPSILLARIKPRGLLFRKKGYNIYVFGSFFPAPTRSPADLIRLIFHYFYILAAATDAFINI